MLLSLPGHYIQVNKGQNEKKKFKLCVNMIWALRKTKTSKLLGHFLYILIKSTTTVSSLSVVWGNRIQDTAPYAQSKKYK